VDTKAEEMPAYKEYRGLASGGIASAPTVQVLAGNTIGAIVWSRVSAGNYIGTLAGAFPLGKTVIVGSGNAGGLTMLGIGFNVPNDYGYSFQRIDDDTISLQVYDDTYANIDLGTALTVGAGQIMIWIQVDP